MTELMDYTDAVLYHANQAGKQREFDTGKALAEQMQREASISEHLRRRWNLEQHSPGLHQWTQGQP